MSNRAAMIEAKLRNQLARDRKRPSNQGAMLEDGTLVVNISGTACGLVYALNLETGESDESILQRMGEDSG